MALLAVVAAATVPRGADLVFSVEDASGVRALLSKAGGYAPSLSPDAVGVSLRNRVGIDLLAESPDWGLARRGARLLAFSPGAAGASAPVRNVAAAKRKLASWLAENPGRAGRVAGSRIYTASGPRAAALLTGMARASPLSRDLAARAKGPLWMWARLAEPLRATVLAIDAGETGLVARGLVTAADSLLAGPAPAGCEGAVACVRAGLGPAGRELLAIVLQQLAAAPQPQLSTAARMEERIEEIDVRALGGPGSWARALRISASFDGTTAAAHALEGSADLAALALALATLTPLDALRGPVAAGTYAAHLLYGQLLRNAGPLTITADAAGGNAAETEIRLPLR